ncbi:flagellar hook-associated protein FlgK [Actinotalea sp. AC32]|nr:flagellar hook-associated protein FlgK [Actinotalea sp. AC32]
MSTFSGLGTALSSLMAQRLALDVAGQNIANANTKGYTRQRAELTSVESLSVPTMFSSSQAAGNGVKVTGISRLGDAFLDDRVRAETGTSSFRKAQASALSRLESTLTEPADSGVAAALGEYWAAWEDVANRPDDTAARQVLIGAAGAVASQVSAGYRSTETQWQQMRTETQTLVTEVNTTAEQVARYNEQIRSIIVTGGSPNELVDQRDQLALRLAELTGATARHRDDGTMDLLVDGNPLVTGIRASALEVTGDFRMTDGTTSTINQVGLRWASTGTPATPTSGVLASHLAVLSPDGPLADAAGTWNALATRLAESVNTIHRTGAGLDGVSGRDFFAVDGGIPATGLRVAVTDPAQVAAAAVGQGTYDGSLADRLSQVGQGADSPDRLWRDFVVDLGVRTRAADQRATVSEAARATAENLQLSQASVDIDEETVNMLAIQRAYEGAARVLTAVDEMLDVLINRTGVVGR